MPSANTLARAPPWTNWKFHYLGEKEDPGNKAAFIRMLCEAAKCGQEGDPWCAIFQNASLEGSMIPGTRSASSQSFRNDPNFVKLDGPALGAIVVFWRGSKDSGLGHVGDYLGESDTHIKTLGGNEGDQVQIEMLAKDSKTFGLAGYYWPKLYPQPMIGAIRVSDATPAHSVSVT
jgi:uncharacterized protein (TIGR02594 family)